ncbi:MAG: DUF1844 domain-containing protein [bacterium]
MAEQKNDEKKKYTVVDKRWADDEAVPAEETAAAEQPAPQVAEAQDTPEPGSVEPGAQDEEEAGERREMRIEDAIRVALGAVREQALFALGLLIAKNRRPEPDAERALKVAKIFNAMADRFVGPLTDIGLSEGERPEPSLEEIVVFCINLMQGQIFMFLGLIANPASGLITKDLKQAKLGIDFCVALFELTRADLSPAVAPQIEAALADLQINFVQAK